MMKHLKQKVVQKTFAQLTDQERALLALNPGEEQHYVAFLVTQDSAGQPLSIRALLRGYGRRTTAGVKTQLTDALADIAPESDKGQ